MSFGSQYNIDELRRPDGTYRDASPGFIRGALRCGHTAHLQTARGTLAIRPYTINDVRLDRDGNPVWPEEREGDNALLEFYPAGSDVREPQPLRVHFDEYGIGLSLALVTAYRWLNGREHHFHAGMPISWYANQKARDAEVLAVLGTDVLLEYVMPGTTNGRETSALVIAFAHGVTKLKQLRSVPHAKVPKYWIEAMRDQGTTDWIGEGQRSGHVPFPTGETA
jgi:hypothetical protein